MTSPERAPSIGVLLPLSVPVRDFVRYARAVEELGFDEVWVPEDLAQRGGIAQAASALAATSRLKVGLGILPFGARNVAFAAMELATLADLYPGRLIVGVGHGMPGWMRQVGVRLASPLTFMAEYLDALQALLRGETVTRAGRYVTLDAVCLQHPPEIMPPVLSGVRGPQSVALAGQMSDGVVLAEPAAPEYIAAAIGQMNHPGTPHVVVYNIAAVDPDPDEARRRVRAQMAWFGEPDWAPHIRCLPFAEEFAARRAHAPSGERFALELPDEWVDQLAVVGSAEHARRRIADMHRAGATSVVLWPVGDEPFAALRGLADVV